MAFKGFQSERTWKYKDINVKYKDINIDSY